MVVRISTADGRTTRKDLELLQENSGLVSPTFSVVNFIQLSLYTIGFSQWYSFNLNLVLVCLCSSFHSL